MNANIFRFLSDVLLVSFMNMQIPMGLYNGENPKFNFEVAMT